MNQHVGNIIVDKRIKERRSFSGGKTYPNYTLYGERRRTIIKAGRRNQGIGPLIYRKPGSLNWHVKNMREKEK